MSRIKDKQAPSKHAGSTDPKLGKRDKSPTLLPQIPKKQKTRHLKGDSQMQTESTIDHVKKFLSTASEKELDRLSNFLLKRKEKQRSRSSNLEDVKMQKPLTKHSTHEQDPEM